jgi:hypothetical protein
MHSITDEMNLIVKPEQSGKTFIMIQEMIKAYTAEEGLDGRKVINFIFCDNSLLLTKQTSKRVEKDLTTYVTEGETYVEFSSRKGNETRDASAAYGAICDGVLNIICCTNGKRVNDISKIVNRVNASPILEGKFTFKVWLDEADKFEKHITKTFLPLSEECGNVEIWLMTATPKNLFKKFNLNIFPMEKTTQSDYHGWKDNRIVKLDDTFGSTGEFIGGVLSSNRQLIQPGTKWYIPGDKTKSSHYDVAMRCIYHQMAVFIVNGDGLTLERPGMASITEEKTEELNPHIRRMYAEHGLDKYAVAITGYLCVSRGISIMSKEFIFDYGILSSCKQKAEASQSAGRLKGNIKWWANYKPPMVFTTDKFDAIATEWEAVSRRLAELAHERKVAGETTVMTNSEFKTMVDESDDLPTQNNSVINPDSYRKYTDLQQVKDAAEIMGYHPTRIRVNKEGFYETSLNAKKRVVSVKEAINKVPTAYGTNNGVKTWRVLIPCYEDTKDKSTLRFILVIRPSEDGDAAAAKLAELDSKIPSSTN